MSDDSISVSLVRKLVQCTSPDGPTHFLLDFEQCSSLEALEYVGEVLQTNTTIQWLEVVFRYQNVTVECMSNLYNFVSHHPTLKVLEIRMGDNGGGRTPVSMVGCLDEVMRLFLLAAAQNGNIERVKLTGRPCEYVTEIFKFVGTICQIQDLELIDFPDSVAASWPLNSTISTLRLRPASSEFRNPFSPDGHPGLTGVLDLLADSSSRGYCIKHLQIEQWSWSMSKYLQSPNSSVESLHLAKVDFRHDLFTGLSPITVFLLGLQGSKTTTELCLESCIFDAKGTEQLLQALKNDTLGVRSLKIIDMELDGKQIQELFECDGLETLEFDGPTDIIDKSVDCVNDGLGSCALSSLSALKIPITSLSALGPSLKIASTTHTLTSLEITDTKLEEADVECLTGLLGDERCQLHYLSLEFSSGFDPRIIKAVEGPDSGISNLCLVDVSGESLPAIVNTLVGSLAQIKTLKSLTIECTDLTPKMEKELEDALPGNWSLENIIFERVVLQNGAATAHKCEPVTSRKFAAKLKDIGDRNRTKKTRSSPTTASPGSVMDGPGLHDIPGSLTELEIS